MKKLTQPGDLLQVLQAEPNLLRKTATPLAAELPVDPNTAPYLVTTTKALMWHPTDHGGRVRAALRRDPLPELYREVVVEFCTTSVQADWGSVYPYTTQGLDQAIAYVASYGIPDVEILVTDSDSPAGGAPTYQDRTVTKVEYLPPRTVLVVPKDRDFLGTALQMGPGGRHLLLVHNPSRGMAVAGWNS
jgi:hypothetical protein